VVTPVVTWERKELLKKGRRRRVCSQKELPRSPGAIGSDLNTVSRLEEMKARTGG
jgi:hypothetical protein